MQANVVSSGVSIRLCGNGRKGLNGLAATFSSTGNSPTMGRACIGLPDSSSSYNIYIHIFDILNQQCLA